MKSHYIVASTSSGTESGLTLTWSLYDGKQRKMINSVGQIAIVNLSDIDLGEKERVFAVCSKFNQCYRTTVSLVLNPIGSGQPARNVHRPVLVDRSAVDRRLPAGVLGRLARPDDAGRRRQVDGQRVEERSDVHGVLAQRKAVAVVRVAEDNEQIGWQRGKIFSVSTVTIFFVRVYRIEVWKHMRILYADFFSNEEFERSQGIQDMGADIIGGLGRFDV